ncbi:MAG: hypothetical protein IKT40_04840 [Bacilli bacterium]|nr:hypothetical protein [Bacilli bacterium]
MAYSEQYMIALGAHSEVEADAWITNFGDLLDANANWEEATEKYLLAGEKAWSDWTEAMYGETSEVASILNNLDSSIESVINESEKLATTITDTVVPGILEEIEAVRAETDAYM